MRKNLLVLVVLFCFANSVAWAQTANPPTTPGTATAPVALPGVSTPKDPAELMKVAADLNGLDSDKLTPWHLKATFQLYDFDGKPTEQGTYEEFWASPHKYKRIYTSPTFTLTEWGTDDGKHYSTQTGGALPPKLVVGLIRSRIVSPLPTAEAVSKEDLSKRSETVGSTKLVCISLSHSIQTGVPSVTHPVSTDGSYCFAEDKPILRISEVLGGVESVADTLALFQNRYVAKTLKTRAYGKPILDLRLEFLKTLATIQHSDFDPPADGKIKQIDSKANTPNSAQPRLQEKAYPIYPADAKRRRVQGIVVLEGVIGTDGRVHDLIPVVSPDPALTEAALNTVKKWKYEPYLENGSPVETETEINIVFNLGP